MAGVTGATAHSHAPTKAGTTGTAGATGGGAGVEAGAEATGPGRGRKRGRGKARGQQRGQGGGQQAADGARAAGGGGTAKQSASGGCGMADRGAGELTTRPVGATGGVAGTTAPTGATPATTAMTMQAGSGTNASMLAQVAQQLAGSPIAQQVLSAMAQGGGDIQVLPDAQFRAKFGAASGAYQPSTNIVSLPQSVASDPEQLRIVLLHEAVHWAQDNVQGGIAGLGGPTAQALEGAGALRNVNPNSKEGAQHDEAQSFVLEALAAQQLGIRDPGMGTSNGRVLGYEQTLARVKGTPGYQ
jgi:hypothetical protein